MVKIKKNVNNNKKKFSETIFKNNKKDNKNNIFKKFFKLFKKPSEAFNEIKSEKGIIESSLFLLLSIVFGRIAIFLATFLPNMGEIGAFFEGFNFSIFLFFGFLQLISVFLIVIGFFIILKIFRIKANIADTFKIISFSAAPYIILGQIIFFDIWVFFLSVFFVIFGIKELFQTSALRAALSVLTAYFIFWLAKFIYGVIVVRLIL
jgi:hypothetical protein